MIPGHVICPRLYPLDHVASRLFQATLGHAHWKPPPVSHWAVEELEAKARLEAQTTTWHPSHRKPTSLRLSVMDIGGRDPGGPAGWPQLQAWLGKSLVCPHASCGTGSWSGNEIVHGSVRSTFVRSINTHNNGNSNKEIGINCRFRRE